MKTKHNTNLIIKVLAVGIVIALLSYLFHPEAGQLSVMYNGQPIADTLGRFAAIPTFLAIMGLTVFLTLLLFLGVGLFMFLGALFIVFTLSFVIAPYFSPVLAIIVLVIALMSFSKGDKD